MRFPLSLLWKGTQKILNTKGNWGHKFLQLHREREEIIQKKKYKKWEKTLFCFWSCQQRVESYWVRWEDLLNLAQISFTPAILFHVISGHNWFEKP